MVTLDVGQEPENLPLLTAEGCAEDEFGKSAELRRMARHSFLEAEAKHQVRVSQASRNRAFKVYHTGDWLYVWRQQHKTHRPRWVGPCTVICHEASHSSPPRGFPSTPGRPGSIVWIISNGYILRACPEHL